MTYGIIDTSTLTNIADAIRGKLGVQTTYKPSEMPEAIESISGGGITPTGTKSITANGTYDVTTFASAQVNVPSSGITPTGTKQINITSNGTTTEDVTAYADAQITVNVPTGSTPTGTKNISITQNGTTTEDVANYANAQISVNVVNEDYESALVALGVTEDLTDGIEALTTYANGVTGESDTNLSDAVHSLGSGYGGGTTYPFLVSYERIVVTEDLTSMTTMQFQNSYLLDLATSAPYPTILYLIENTYTDSRYSAQAAIRLSSLSGSYSGGTSRFFVRSNGKVDVGNNSFGIGQGSVLHKYTFETA